MNEPTHTHISVECVRMLAVHSVGEQCLSQVLWPD